MPDPAEKQDAPDNGNTDLLRVKHKDKRVWFGISDTAMWRIIMGGGMALLLGKNVLFATPPPSDHVAVLAIQTDLKTLSDAIEASKNDIQDLRKSVDRLDIDTAKLQQALSDSRK